jgi:hypothetical protein
MQGETCGATENLGPAFPICAVLRGSIGACVALTKRTGGMEVKRRRGSRAVIVALRAEAMNMAWEMRDLEKQRLNSHKYNQKENPGRNYKTHQNKAIINTRVIMAEIFFIFFADCIAYFIHWDHFNYPK